MAFSLLIGDTGEYLALLAAKYSLQSCLLDSANCNKKLQGVYYTSLGDLDRDVLYEICKKADKIIFCPPIAWSDDRTHHSTQSMLRDLRIFDKKNIENLEGTRLRFGVDSSYLAVADQRKSAERQLWIAGCSFAHGIALGDSSRRYGQLIADHFNIPVSFLSHPGSSIDWACDQIIRADINPQDIVVWGITGINRMTWFGNQHQPLHVYPSILSGKREDAPGYKTMTSEQKMMLHSMLIDDSRFLINLKHIEQVIRYCNRIGANLVLVAHEELSQVDHAEWLVSYLESTNYYVKTKSYPYDDLGIDNEHPGPLTHQQWANQIITHIENKKWVK